MEAAGVVEIGLSRAEFWALTHRQFQNLFDRYIDREIRHERRTALLATLYANAHRDPQKRAQPFTLEDFAPPLRGSEAKPSRSATQSPAAQLELMKAHHDIRVAKGAPAGAWGKLSQEELDALYGERHRPPPGVH
jgi:hypothetical protein